MRNRYQHIGSKNQTGDKVLAALVDYVFRQTNIATFASFFCASIIFLGLYSQTTDNAALFLWYGLLIVMVLLRFVMVTVFKRQSNPTIKYWRQLYIVTFVGSGIAWGLAAILLLPYIEPPQQMLLMLMIAGVTAAAVPLSSAIPEACIGFLSGVILPFIFSIAYYNTGILELFNVTLVLYYIYMIVISVKNYHLVKRTVILRFENDSLLVSLTDAKQKLELTNQKLMLSSTHDPLTEVANRNLFSTNLSIALKELAMSSKNLALLYLDIDRFKLVNDTFGHGAGDQLLLELTDRMKKYLRSSDMIARMGGDEFTIILTRVNNREDVGRIAQDLCRLIAMPVTIDQHEICVTASIGISLSPQDGTDAETLIRNADMAMYHIKSLGGNHFEFYTKLAVHSTA